MVPRGPTRNTARILLPALLAFSLQWSMEVFHPIEEAQPAAHTHGDGGPALFDPTACSFDSHGPHFCAHSGVYAGLAHGGTILHADAHRPEHFNLPQRAQSRPASDTLKRGPPFLV